MWRTSARRGGIRALDLKDFDREERALCFRHRPNAGTFLKNGERGERDVNLAPNVASVIADYIDSPNRHKVTDEYGRAPLLTTQQGQPSLSTLQGWIYRVTRPCVIGEPCPHDYDPATYEFMTTIVPAGIPRPSHLIPSVLDLLRPTGTLEPRKRL